MGISAQESIVIKRPIEDVFAFLSNMENSPLYGRTIKTAKVSDGPISVGTEFREEGKLMGRRMTGLVEVTEFDPPTRFSYVNRMGNIFERANFTFEAVGEGTRTSFAGEGDMGRFGELLAPIFSRMASREMQSLFKSLKVVLEAPAGPTA